MKISTGCVVTFMLIIVINIPIEAMSDEINDMEAGWQYRWGESPVDSNGIPLFITSQRESTAWQNAEAPFNLKDRRGEYVLWLRYPVPNTDWVDPTVFFTNVFIDFEAYMNDWKKSLIRDIQQKEWGSVQD